MKLLHIVVIFLSVLFLLGNNSILVKGSVKLRALNPSFSQTAALNFGVIEVTPALSGSVTIYAAKPPSQEAITCSTTLYCGGGAFSQGEFSVSGTPNTLVKMSFLSSNRTLTSGINTMSLRVTLSSTSVILDSTGKGAFGVGGTLTVKANQAEGVYSGSYTLVLTY